MIKEKLCQGPSSNITIPDASPANNQTFDQPKENYKYSGKDNHKDNNKINERDNDNDKDNMTTTKTRHLIQYHNT